MTSSSSPGAFAWGYGRDGELGNGGVENSDVPVSVCAAGSVGACPSGPFLSEVTAVSGGSFFSSALLANGTVVKWGEQYPEEKHVTPLAVPGLSEVTAIVAGGNHGLALLRNGTVMAWGYNGFGQLGNGTTASTSTPVAVSGLKEVTAVAAGYNYSLALLRNGTVESWGLNESGALGNGSTAETSQLSPKAVTGLSEVRAIAAGLGGVSSALLANGTVMDWGFGQDGQLGNGGTSSSGVPVKVSGLGGVVALPNGGEGMALLNNGTVVDWGLNSSGQLGTGSSSGPELCEGAPCSRVPVAVGGLSGVTAIAGGLEHRLALLSNGTVSAWGSGVNGQLGNGSTQDSDVPVTVSTLSGAGSIAAGQYHSLAASATASASPPTVTKVEPNHGPLAGGTTVTITGTRFTGATAVSFGSLSAKSFTVKSASSISAVSPAGSGNVDVTVTTPEGTSAASPSDVFNYTPTVTGVEPNSGPAAGGTSVSISGTGFLGATSVKFGGAKASSFTVSSSGSITAVSPPGKGVVDVTVTTPAGTSATSSADKFNYGPSVTKVEPNYGPAAGGTSVIITGTNFSGAKEVKFGGAKATSFSVTSAESITAVSPAGKGVVDVTVVTPGGTSATSSADKFNYGPSVTGVEPNAGPLAGGTSVTITGTNFTGAKEVKFGGTKATSFKVNSESSITAVSPAGKGTVDVTVITPGGTSATSSADHFSYVTTPAVTKVEPSQGPETGGTSVTITGSNLTGATAVRFGGASAGSFSVSSSTSITAVSPAGSGTVDVTVTTAAGTSAASTADRFSYVAVPTCSKSEPSHGPAAGGTTVMLTGAGFSGATAVRFGERNAASYTVNSETSITAVSPPLAPRTSAKVPVTVTTAAGTSAVTAVCKLAYEPLVEGVRPRSGPPGGGTSVTIEGRGFKARSIGEEAEHGFWVQGVKFGANAVISAEFKVGESPFGEEITVTDPAGTGTVDVTVNTQAGTSPLRPADQFTYGEPPTVTNAEPREGPPAGGTSVTITGTNFTGASAVKFGENNAESYTVNSETSITAVSPPGKPGYPTGTVYVTVTTPAGTSTANSGGIFHYQPIITKVEPSSGPAGGGTRVTIYGEGFAEAPPPPPPYTPPAGDCVRFGATSAGCVGSGEGVTVYSNTLMSATSPPGSGTVDVTMTNEEAKSPTSPADLFSYF